MCPYLENHPETYSPQSCLKPGNAPQHTKSSKSLWIRTQFKTVFWLELTFGKGMSVTVSIHNPFPSWLPWFRIIYFGLLFPWYSSQCYVFYRKMRVRDGARHCRISSGVRCQLHCKWIRPVFTAFLLPSGMKFSNCCSSPQQGEGFPLDGNFQTPLQKLWEWMLVSPDNISIFLDILPPQWIFFLLFLVQYARYARLQNKVSWNGCWERSRMRRATPFFHSVSLPLSLCLPLPLSRLHPPSCTPPPCLSLHLPTLSFSISSSPLIHTQRYAVLYLWLLTIMTVPLPAVSDRKVHRPYSTEKQIMLEKYVQLNRYEEKEQQHWKQMQFNLLTPSSLLDY